MAAAEAVALVDIEAAVSRRAEYRAGYDAGRKAGAVAFFSSAVTESIAVELVLQRAVAESLGNLVDYWRNRADEMELEATHWHAVAASRVAS